MPRWRDHPKQHFPVCVDRFRQYGTFDHDGFSGQLEIGQDLTVSHHN
jgi:hypothetical protein